MLTADQCLSYQQNMQERKLALVVLSTNKEKITIANTPRILQAAVPQVRQFHVSQHRALTTRPLKLYFLKKSRRRDAER